MLISSFPFRPAQLAQPAHPTVVSYLTPKSSPSSTPRRRLVKPTWLPRLPPRSHLLMAYHYHSLISAIIAIYNLYSLHAPLIPAVGRYRGQRLNAPSPDPINRPPRPRRSPHLPHITLPPLSKPEHHCCRAFSPLLFPRHRPVATLPSEPR
jgi:hypothetical protein